MLCKRTFEFISFRIGDEQDCQALQRSDFFRFVKHWHIVAFSSKRAPRGMSA